MNLNKSQIFFKLFLVFLFVLIFSICVNAVGVRPLVVNLDMKPGESKEFELKITPENNQQTVGLNLYHPRQQLSGSLSYEKGDPKQHPTLNWINIKNQVVVPPKEENTVTGKVKVPYGAEGSHTGIIMVEPITKANQGISFKIRYAVRVNSNIERPGLRRRVNVSDFKLKSNKEKSPVVSAIIKNPSSLDYHAHGEVTIRDENRRLVQRVPITSQYAKNSGRKKTKIYPGSKVEFKGKITEVLHPGTYNLRLFLYYANGKQEIMSKSIEIGNKYLNEENIKYIELTPSYIEDYIRIGGATTKVLQIRNRTGKQLQVKVQGQNINKKYSQSLFKDLKVQLRGQKNFELKPRRSGRTIVLIRSSRDIKPGGYYGKLKLGVFNKNGKNLETRMVDMGILIGKDYKHQVDIKGITSHKDKKKYIFSLSLKNKGPAHFSPKAKVYLKNDKDEIINTLRLKLPEGRNRILPEMSGHLVTTRKDIKPGDYTAEITVMIKGEEISKKEFPIHIKGEKGEKE